MERGGVMRYLVIDIGGSFIKYALMDSAYYVMMTDQLSTPKEGLADELVEALGKLYDRFAGEIDSMAIAAPGDYRQPERIFLYTGGASI